MNKIEVKPKSVGVKIILDGRELSPDRSRKVWNHSMDFNVGYLGSGPAQTALAILLEFTDDDTAGKLHQKFKFQYVSEWEVGGNYRVDVRGWLMKNGVQDV